MRGAYSSQSGGNANGAPFRAKKNTGGGALSRIQPGSSEGTPPITPEVLGPEDDKYLDWEEEARKRLAWRNYRTDEKEELLGRDFREYVGEEPREELPGDPLYDDVLWVKAFLEVLATDPKALRPLDRRFNPAALLWKKIGEIADAERWRLAKELESEHIKVMWKLAKDRFRYPFLLRDFPALANFPNPDRGPHLLPYVWEGQVSGILEEWSRFQKVFFAARDGKLYGRLVLEPERKGWVRSFLDRRFPLYFQVQPTQRVVASGEPAELKFVYGDGQLHLQDLGVPEGFPQPAKHPIIFRDAFHDYVRAAGPGVLVGQGWREGISLESAPKAFLGEFVLVRRPFNKEQAAAFAK